MPNTADTAARWTHYLTSRAYIPRAHLIQEHFASGKISRLCECGCQSFDLAIDADVPLEPLLPASKRGGCALALSYRVAGHSEDDFIDIRIFVDSRGYLSGVDVDYRANSSPMPDDIALIEPPFHIHGALSA